MMEVVERVPAQRWEAAAAVAAVAAAAVTAVTAAAAAAAAASTLGVAVTLLAGTAMASSSLM